MEMCLIICVFSLLDKLPDTEKVIEKAASLPIPAMYPSSAQQ
jgi:hypothetical protein